MCPFRGAAECRAHRTDAPASAWLRGHDAKGMGGGFFRRPTPEPTEGTTAPHARRSRLGDSQAAVGNPRDGRRMRSPSRRHLGKPSPHAKPVDSLGGGVPSAFGPPVPMPYRGERRFAADSTGSPSHASCHAALLQTGRRRYGDLREHPDLSTTGRLGMARPRPRRAERLSRVGKTDGRLPASQSGLTDPE